MKIYYQLVHGEIISEIYENIKISEFINDKTKVFAFTHSCFSVPKHSIFNYLTIKGVNYQIFGRLTYITQQLSLPFDEIPYGWKTVCVIGFDELHDCLKLIPLTDGWVSLHDIEDIEIGFDDDL